jgi:protein PET100
MAGPNLEVFKFAVYVFFPVLVFLHYGDPEWYQTNVIPVRSPFLRSPQVSSRANPSIYLSSTKNEYSRPKRGRHVIATSQPIMPLCVKSSSVSRQKKRYDVRSVNVTRLRLRETPLGARGSKGWCSYGGSEVRPVAYLYPGICTSLALSTASY